MKEMYRQALHLILGVLITATLLLDILDWWHLLVLAGVFTFFSLLYVEGIKVPILSWCYKQFGREKELKWLPAHGFIFYLLSSSISVLLFPKDIAIASILILAFGDSFSSLIGQYGTNNHKHNDTKTVEGSVAGILLATIASSIFVGLYHAFIASTIVMLLETVDMKIGKFYIDDNIFIPLVSGLILFLMMM
jgi:dolichol kinase